MEHLKTYWDQIYSENKENEVSWYQEKPSLSLRLIEATGMSHDQPIIDVGGGESYLVDHLMESGFKKIAVLDISSAALKHTQKRLGDRATQIEWIEADVKEFHSKHRFALWHDRAVFHFLTEEQDRQAYLRTLKEVLLPGGHFIIATFALDGPKQCSGLPIAQYDAESLRRFFGGAFELKEIVTETHRTPWNTEQKFIYCRFQLKS